MYDRENVMALPGAYAAEQSFVIRVFLWMFAGLAVTGGVALVFSATPALLAIVAKAYIFILLAELGLVIAIGALIRRISTPMAAGMFVLYSAMTGATMSVLFLVFTAESLITTFAVTSLTFAAMALYGYTTKRDLTAIGSLCLMALLGVIIVSIVNWFLRSDLVSWIVTFVGIAVFVGLIAYDTQKIKRMAAHFAENSEGAGKYAVLAALAVYLDFINLFLLLLRLFGRRR